MRDIKRRPQLQRPRVKLLRGADGRLQHANGSETEIGDVWAQQRRIRLAEAIAADQQKAERQARRTARVAHILDSAKAAGRKLARLRPGHIPRRWWLISGAVVAGIAALFVVLAVTTGPNGQQARGQGKGAPAATTTKLPTQTPKFQTLLPAGKTISQLGGWARVSPPDKDPVYAYIDTVEGVQLSVSQQQLPASFKTDVVGQVAKLAEQFNATQKIAVDDITAYVGTSIKGPQSVVLAKGDVLILVKSSATLTTEQWTQYLARLTAQ